MEVSEVQEEIEDYRAKCEALKSTWLAANQNFLYFQVSFYVFLSLLFVIIRFYWLMLYNRDKKIFHKTQKNQIFQKMAHEDLEKAKTIMTKSQLETWENLRKRDTEYEKRRDSYSVYAHGEGLQVQDDQKEDVSPKFKLVKKSEIEELQSRLRKLNEEIKKKEEILNILEPSCGSCSFIDKINDIYNSKEIIGVENNELIYSSNVET